MNNANFFSQLVQGSSFFPFNVFLMNPVKFNFDLVYPSICKKQFFPNEHSQIWLNNANLFSSFKDRLVQIRKGRNYCLHNIGHDSFYKNVMKDTLHHFMNERSHFNAKFTIKAFINVLEKYNCSVHERKKSL